MGRFDDLQSIPIWLFGILITLKELMIPMDTSMGMRFLLHFAQQMQKVFRDDDCLFRYGGEEFVVIMKNIESSQIEMILHRFREHIESY